MLLSHREQVHASFWVVPKGAACVFYPMPDRLRLIHSVSSTRGTKIPRELRIAASRLHMIPRNSRTATVHSVCTKLQSTDQEPDRYTPKDYARRQLRINSSPMLVEQSVGPNLLSKEPRKALFRSQWQKPGRHSRLEAIARCFGLR